MSSKHVHVSWDTRCTVQKLRFVKDAPTDIHVSAYRPRDRQTDTHTHTHERPTDQQTDGHTNLHGSDISHSHISKSKMMSDGYLGYVKDASVVMHVPDNGMK